MVRGILRRLISTFRYETHLHTSQSSRCARSEGRASARFYLDQGYKGIIVTDHFFGGNTCASHEGPWRERVRQFCLGYEDALNEGLRIGLDVFFGWEQTFAGDDYLVYGLDPSWLLEHPEVEHWNRREQLEQVHAYGGCVVQAHPFRSRAYIPRILLGPSFCDAVEIANGSNTPLENACAKRYAQEYGLMAVAGSDNHDIASGKPLFGVAFDTPLSSMADYVARIRAHAPIELLVPAAHAVLPEDEHLSLSCHLLTPQETDEPFQRDWLPAI